VATFKSFNLGWLADTKSVFDSLGVLLFNIEILQLRCNIPSISYISEWAVFMLMPWAILFCLLILVHSFGFVWGLVEYAKLRGKPQEAPLAVKFRYHYRKLEKKRMETFAKMGQSHTLRVCSHCMSDESADECVVDGAGLVSRC
jgi:hypothetical protein